MYAKSSFNTDMLMTRGLLVCLNIALFCHLLLHLLVYVALLDGKSEIVVLDSLNESSHIPMMLLLLCAVVIAINSILTGLFIFAHSPQRVLRYLWLLMRLSNMHYVIIAYSIVLFTCWMASFQSAFGMNEKYANILFVSFATGISSILCFLLIKAVELSRTKLHLRYQQANQEQESSVREV